VGKPEPSLPRQARLLPKAELHPPSFLYRVALSPSILSVTANASFLATRVAQM